MNRAILSVFILQIKQSLSRATFKFVLFAQPIIFCILFHYVYTGNIADSSNSVIFNSMFMTLWSCLCFSAIGDINREREQGTLEYLCSTPTSFSKIVISKILANTFLGILSIIICILASFLFFGETISIEHSFCFFICLIVLILSFFSISLFFCALITSKRNMIFIINNLIDF